MTETMWRLTIAVIRLVRVTGHLVRGLLTVVIIFPGATDEIRSGHMRRWSRSLLDILGIERSLTGVMPTETEKSTLLVANHVSWLDVVAQMSVGATAFVAKSEVRQWPVIGWMAQQTGTTFIERSRRHDIARVNDALTQTLAAGACAAIFPEGTTTDGTRLLQFHSGLFEAARDAHARVWPVAIRYRHADGTISHAADFLGDASLLSSLWRIALAPSVRICMAFAAPLSAHDRLRRDMAALSRGRIAALLRIEQAPLESHPMRESAVRRRHGGAGLSAQQHIA